MKNKEVIDIEVNQEEVPSIIQEQFMGLAKLRRSVSEATYKADIAKTSAQKASQKNPGIGQKREAIEAAQEAIRDLSDAQISQAQAQEVSFEYQQKIAEITKYLFALGVSNIAMNRTVVRELKKKLKGASEDELDEFAKKEILSVVQQLKAQEDIMQKQSDLALKVKSHEKKSKEHDKKLQEHEEHEKKQDEKIRKNSEKNKEQDRLLAEKTQKDKSQDDELARQASIGKKLSERIEATALREKELDEKIERQTAIGQQLKDNITFLVEKEKKQDEEIELQRQNYESFLQIAEQLEQENVDKSKQIEELRVVCEGLESLILANSRQIEEKDKYINSILSDKADNKAMVISYLVGIVALILAVIGFFV